MGGAESGGGQSWRRHLYCGCGGEGGRATGEIAGLSGHWGGGLNGEVFFLRDQCGFDVAIDYNVGPVAEQLKGEAPDGIDVYFDNVGGTTCGAALSALRVYGRIVACGGISAYNNEKPQPGPSNLFNITTKRSTMKGLIVRDWLDRRGEFEKEVGSYLEPGKLINKGAVVEGINQAVGAFIGLFEGKNVSRWRSTSSPCLSRMAVWSDV
ncbi:MAG: 2-alkenal reductase [Chthoniobacteraceae bacterium]|nr:2-alkenal reductase [Chthoniobacteraceae bacterium]